MALLAIFDPLLQGMTQDYRYIVIEGNIGAGKTSLATMIANRFNARVLLERFADNPFLPKFYEDPSRYSFPLELSFLADRYMQMKDELGSLEIFAPFTVADYYFNKSLVFASATLREDEYKLYRQLFHIILNSLPRPDLYVYLNADTDRLMKNIKARGRDYESGITPEYLNGIQTAYFNYFRQNPGYRYLIINMGETDFVNNEDDFQKILDEIFNKERKTGINRLFLD